MLVITQGLNITTFRVRKRGMREEEGRTCLIGFKNIRTAVTLKNSLQNKKHHMFYLPGYVATPVIMDNTIVSCIQSMNDVVDIVLDNDCALFIVDLIYNDYITGTMCDKPSLEYLEDFFQEGSSLINVLVE